MKWPERERFWWSKKFLSHLRRFRSTFFGLAELSPPLDRCSTPFACEVARLVFGRLARVIRQPIFYHHALRAGFAAFGLNPEPQHGRRRINVAAQRAPNEHIQIAFPRRHRLGLAVLLVFDGVIE